MINQNFKYAVWRFRLWSFTRQRRMNETLDRPNNISRLAYFLMFSYFMRSLFNFNFKIMYDIGLNTDLSRCVVGIVFWKMIYNEKCTFHENLFRSNFGPFLNLKIVFLTLYDPGFHAATSEFYFNSWLHENLFAVKIRFDNAL